MLSEIECKIDAITDKVLVLSEIECKIDAITDNNVLVCYLR